MSSRVATAILASLLALVAMPALANASWRGQGTGNGSARAVSAPAGTTASASALARTITVAWTAPSSGPAPTGYAITRAPAAGGSSLAPPAGTCASTVTGLTCTETSVPTGSWKYAVRPLVQKWTGAAGSASATVTIGAPALALGTSSFTSLPAAPSASVSGFSASETVTMHLDTAGGTVLATSPSTVTTTSGGLASITSVTLPAGLTDGAHTVYAVGSAGNQATAAVSVSGTLATATGLTIVNGTGTSRQATTGDVVTMTFDKELQPSSLCSAWPATSSTKSVTGTVRLVRTSTSTTLDVTTATGCTTLNIGTIDLGRIDLGSATGMTASFASSTIAWNAATKQLVLTLGGTPTVTGGTLTRGSSSTSTVTYTPAAAMRSLVVGLVAGTSKTISPF